MPSLNLSSIFSLKRHTQIYYLNSLRKRMGGWEVYPTAPSSFHNIGQSVLQILSINKKNVNEIPDIEVFSWQ